MNKRASLSLAVAAFLAGSITGGSSVAIFEKRSAENALISQLAAEASTTVVVLERLRAGNTTNAVECLELSLDSDLLGLGLLLDGRELKRELKRDPSNIQAIQMVRVYRTFYPHKFGSPEAEQAAAKAFRFTFANLSETNSATK